MCSIYGKRETASVVSLEKGAAEYSETLALLCEDTDSSSSSSFRALLCEAMGRDLWQSK